MINALRRNALNLAKLLSDPTCIDYIRRPPSLLHTLLAPPHPPRSSTPSPLLHTLPAPPHPPRSSTPSPLLHTLPAPPHPPRSSTPPSQHIE
ncbi:hypothetical protein JB92DRAFT_3127650 [Gautieria morchelliformis]|nr:hypothetical protein JB92DRAFT_3127650 [Gautieria morchelliformis]